ncbi:MAG: hypothetical protein ABIQ95_13660 [Bdellovibrionia bacterium]
MRFFSFKFCERFGFTILLPLLVCACVTARPQSNSSLKDVSPSGNTRGPTNISDQDELPLAILQNRLVQEQERLKNRTKIRFTKTIECDDGSVIPLSDVPRITDIQRFPRIPKIKDSWKTDQEASRSREERACRLAEMHQRRLAHTAREITALYEIQVILAQAKVLLNKKMNIKDIKIQIQDLDEACNELLSLKEAIEVARVSADSRANKLYRIKAENLQWVLDAAASVSEQYDKSKDRTKLQETLKEAIVVVEEVLSDFMVDLQEQSYRVRGETLKSLQPIAP